MNTKTFISISRQHFKILFLVFIISLLGQSLHAQVASYIATTSNIGAYVPITGGHVDGGANDDDNYYLDSIGFSFNYNGSYYTTFYVDANGFIKLGSSTPSATYFAGPPLTLNPYCISAFANDLQGQNLSTSEMRVQTIGTAPNRTCVIQFRDWGLYPAPSTSTASELYNFQIRLNENNGWGSVQIVYGSFSTGATSSAPLGTISGTWGVQAGITGSTITDFNIRAGSTWTTTTSGGYDTCALSVYTGNVPDSGRTFIFTPLCAVSYDTISAPSQSVCSGSTAIMISGSVPIGSYSTFAYTWQSSTTGPTSGFSAASGSYTSQFYFPGYITSDTWFRRVANYGSTCSDTTPALLISVANTNVWNGNSSNSWANAANWGCGRVPLYYDSVVIPSGVANMPVIIDGGRVANSLTILSSASLTLNNSASSLTISGIFTLAGNFIHSNGTVTMNGSSAQTIPPATFYNLTLNNSSGFVLNGPDTIYGTLTMTTGNLGIGNTNLTMAGTVSSPISGAGSSKYIVTNGTGTLNIKNVNTNSRGFFPVGSSTSYNPLTLIDTTNNEYRVRVFNGVSNSYTGVTPGTLLSGNAVNRTWVVYKTVNGSMVTMHIQWNAFDELTGFNRTASYVSKYAAPWNSSSTGAATGVDPYVRIGGFYFPSATNTLFGVGSGGTLLPVDLISFTGVQTGNSVELKWITASEINNDHYEIEKSIDHSSWSMLGKVNGSGTTNIKNEYQYTDLINLSTYQPTNFYYRLRQVDQDGDATEIGVIEVSFSRQYLGTEMIPQPNPFSSNLTVSINAATSENVRLKFTDITGRLIIEQSTALHPGENILELNNLDVLKDGMYFLTIQTGDQIVTKKVICSNP
ncbi:MAG: T9SS type A sorting domain-containing protein [Bacteroidia bacterium]